MTTNRILSFLNDGSSLSARDVVDIDISGLSINSVPMGNNQALTSDGSGNVGFTNLSSLPYALPYAQFHIAASTNLNSAATVSFTLIQDVNNITGLTVAAPGLTFGSTGTYFIAAQYSYAASVLSSVDLLINVFGGAQLSRVLADGNSVSNYQSCIRVNTGSENIRFTSIRNGADATAKTTLPYDYSCLMFVVKLA